MAKCGLIGMKGLTVTSYDPRYQTCSMQATSGITVIDALEQAGK